MLANTRVSVELQFVELKAVKADEVSDCFFFFFPQLFCFFLFYCMLLNYLIQNCCTYQNILKRNRNKKVVLQKAACVCVTWPTTKKVLMSHSERQSRPVGGLSAHIHTTESGSNGLKHLKSVQCMLLSRFSGGELFCKTLRFMGSQLQVRLVHISC